jgi:hyaluronoglucosaminidase
MTYIEDTRRLTDERYILETSVSAGKPNIKITASSKRGVRDAVNAIYRQIRDGSLFVGVIEDYPLFYKRGYIEGFYGKPWSFEERIDMLELMSEHCMNTYFYAPKDDPYHRNRWGELYLKAS